MSTLAMQEAGFRPVRPLNRLFLDLFGAERLFAETALVLMLMIPPTLLAMAFDGRMLLGENLWIKPLKFEISLTLYFLTLAFFARWLPAGMTETRWYRLFAGGVVLSTGLEMLWIGAAATQGIQSHFNTTNPLMAALYPMMGALATYLTSSSLIYGLAIRRAGGLALEPAFRFSVIWGLILTFALTVPVAGGMAVAFPGHAVGAGDLRVPHFLATHAMHFLPVAGYAAGRLLPGRMALPAVRFFTLGFVLFVAYSLAEAAMGFGFLGLIF
ncbi:hypothetical protein [Oceanibaculum sp.]|uniref:hypothetical protein n=1 Tax=Oceanibaculum sp. TaxID=1903597 RepID=UPI00258C7177|nr:hypothetical protein [Oceanibaculum sp.]MCH2393435.1 hypothetical protein [Oceanibaculum sp.]